MSDLIVALGLVFVIEGLLWAALPHAVIHILEMVQHMPDHVLRAAGMAVMALGVALVWLVRH